MKTFKNKYIDGGISTLVGEGMILIPPSIMSSLLYVVWNGVWGGNQDSHRCTVPERGEGRHLLMAFLDTCWLFPLTSIKW